MISNLFTKEKMTRYFKSLKFSLYCMSHPMDGFWDLTHEKRGSYAAANTILIATVVMRILGLRFTSFVIEPVNWEELNVLVYVLSIIFPLLLFVVGNWALTTLFDGKGRLGQVYMGTCYALLPYPLFHLPLMIISNFVTVDEASLFNVIDVCILIYAAILIISAMGQIHEFSGGKNLLFMFASLGAMVVMIFLLLLFFSMISQGAAYFISLGKEMMFRI